MSESESRSDRSPFGALWLAGLVFVLVTLAVWVFFYVRYGEAGQLNGAETTVVAIVIAVAVFGTRWCILRFRKPKTRAKEAES
jgi:heme/copper-type cytochrome/quinol oxidase subunit 4